MATVFHLVIASALAVPMCLFLVWYDPALSVAAAVSSLLVVLSVLLAERYSIRKEIDSKASKLPSFALIVGVCATNIALSTIFDSLPSPEGFNLSSHRMSAVLFSQFFGIFCFVLGAIAVRKAHKTLKSERCRSGYGGAGRLFFMLAAVVFFVLLFLWTNPGRYVAAGIVGVLVGISGLLARRYWPDGTSSLKDLVVALGFPFVLLAVTFVFHSISSPAGFDLSDHKWSVVFFADFFGLLCFFLGAAAVVKAREVSSGEVCESTSKSQKLPR